MCGTADVQCRSVAIFAHRRTAVGGDISSRRHRGDALFLIKNMPLVPPPAPTTTPFSTPLADRKRRLVENAVARRLDRAVLLLSAVYAVDHLAYLYAACGSLAVFLRDIGPRYASQVVLVVFNCRWSSSPILAMNAVGSPAFPEL